MADSRITEYRRAAEAMITGEYAIDVPADAADEVGKLGQTLKALGRALGRRFEESAKLTELTERINAGLLLDDVLNHVFDSFRTIIPYDRIGFALLEDDGRQVRAMWARSLVPKLHITRGYSAPMNGSSLQRVLETGRPRILNDLEAYLQEHPDSDSTRRIVAEGMRSSLTCPLVAMGSPVGFMFFSSRTPHTYEDVHSELFHRIAGQLSLIVEKGRLYEELLETKRQLEEANKRLARLATHDSLTGIPNRRGFDDRFDMEWRRAARDGTPLSIIMLDIDRFKRFNDTYGHLAGDHCLKAVAEVLARGLRRAHDFVARYGGEEFAAILANTEIEVAAQVADMLRRRVEALHIPHSRSPVGSCVTVSAGVASTIPSQETSPNGLVDAADRALYRAKTQGRNRVGRAEGIESS